MKPNRLPLAFACCLLAVCTAGWAARAVLAAEHPQQPAGLPTEDAKIRVGVKVLEPFVFLDAKAGSPIGFSIDLWNAIAADMGAQYEWVLSESVNQLLTDVGSGKIDAALSAISMTPQREGMVDFTYPYFESGLQIMIRDPQEASTVNLTGIFFSSILLKMLGVGLVALIIMAHLIWLFEMRSNPNMPQSYLKGIWDSIWWALRMLIKQEYLDAGMPARPLKRLFVMAYMVFGIVLIAEFTATITTSQTVSQLRPTIDELSDLTGKRVLTMAGSTAEEFLILQEVRHDTVERIDDAFTALLNDETDAIVFDTPVLLFYAQNQGYGQVKVVGPIFQEEDYGIALPTGSPLRKPINTALLRLHSSGRYDAIYKKWFGATK